MCRIIRSNATSIELLYVLLISFFSFVDELYIFIMLLLLRYLVSCSTMIFPDSIQEFSDIVNRVSSCSDNSSGIEINYQISDNTQSKCDCATSSDLLFFSRKSPEIKRQRDRISTTSTLSELKSWGDMPVQPISRIASPTIVLIEQTNVTITNSQYIFRYLSHGWQVVVIKGQVFCIQCILIDQNTETEKVNVVLQLPKGKGQSNFTRRNVCKSKVERLGYQSLQGIIWCVG